eukprot:TRINITY_DN6215_c0_g1_i1.p1 TRINITY_DN6215_c0_g1~~TRINITY_DN6215_c0_g1_i1.p1  ORF type:complete len:118 (-),score=6.37 TRINITY_DN6215_c0_g1_i1:50-403(-)
MLQEFCLDMKLQKIGLPLGILRACVTDIVPHSSACAQKGHLLQHGPDPGPKANEPDSFSFFMISSIAEEKHKRKNLYSIRRVQIFPFLQQPSQVQCFATCWECVSSAQPEFCKIKGK